MEASFRLVVEIWELLGVIAYSPLSSVFRASGDRTYSNRHIGKDVRQRVSLEISLTNAQTLQL